MCELLVDTDALIKFAAYRLFESIAHPGCDAGCGRRFGIVGASKYVAKKRLAKIAADAEGAIEALSTQIAQSGVLEPTADELALAGELELAANQAGLDLDVGESQLCAISILRGPIHILTGDKRAIIAIEGLMGLMAPVLGLAEQLGCVEQATILAVERLGALVVRACVLAEPAIDKTLNICFQYTNPSVTEDFYPTGLTSYINDLRSAAPTVLMPGELLRAVSS